MKLVLIIAAAGAFAGAMASCRSVSTESTTMPDWSNQYDRALASKIAMREADWRIGPVVYQVLVDRFVPPTDVEAKRKFFQAPRKMMDWAELPVPGTRVPEIGCYSHELEFWGGDLAGVRSRLDYVKGLGVDVVYLNPIQQAYTNHKYDAQDYAAVSPEYGTREDVKALAAAAHGRGMKLMLDGVFNHMGKTAPIFQEALKDPKSPWRKWFYFGEQYKLGYRGWYNIPNLPEVDLENPAVRAAIWEDRDSVVRGYLRDGVDGWRLDVAYDIGFVYLSEITKAAHEEKPGSAVIGEIWNDPAQWTPALDGVMNFHLRQLLLDWMDGKIAGGRCGRLIQEMVDDAGIEAMLRAWVVLDNHDTSRLKARITEPVMRRTARVLQFTVAGSPCVYYGTEVEMEGGDDPRNRAPMRWDLVKEDNPDLVFFRKLIAMRKGIRSLRVGDFRVLDSEKLLAFVRRTDKAEETVIVAANATALPVTEVLAVRDSKLMNFAPLVDELTGRQVKVLTGLIEIEVPAHGVVVLRPVENPKSEYSPYKRVK